MTKKQAGACGCNAVHYNITGPVRAVVNCHCNSCKKINGTPFSTYCVVSQDDLELVEGKELVKTYELANGAKKQICSNCGSPLFNAHDRYPGMYMVYYGSLSDYLSVVPSFNIYCENKLPWVDDISVIKSFEQAVER